GSRLSNQRARANTNPCTNTRKANPRGVLCRCMVRTSLRARHTAPRMKRIGQSAKRRPQHRVVPQQHALEAIVVNPLKTSLGVNLSSVLGRIEPVAFQATGGHKNENAK